MAFYALVAKVYLTGGQYIAKQNDLAGPCPQSIKSQNLPRPKYELDSIGGTDIICGISGWLGYVTSIMVIFAFYNGRCLFLMAQLC